MVHIWLFLGNNNILGMLSVGSFQNVVGFCCCCGVFCLFVCLFCKDRKRTYSTHNIHEQGIFSFYFNNKKVLFPEHFENQKLLAGKL